MSAGVVADSSSSELSARQMLRGATAEGFFIDDAGGVWMHMDTGLWLLLGTDTHRAEPG